MTFPLFVHPQEEPHRSETISRSVLGSGVGRGDAEELPREDLRLIPWVDDTIAIDVGFTRLEGDASCRCCRGIVGTRRMVDRS